jgi:energy-coupling factor transporter ATP-binding protein EcfA2
MTQFNTQQAYKIWAISKGIVTVTTLASCATFWQYATSKNLAWLYSGLAMNGVAVAASKLDDDTASILGNRLTLSNLARNNVEYQIMIQQVEPESFELFNWQDIKDKPDKYPHILLVGDTGAGKSTMVNNIAGLMQPALTVAVVPHWQRGEFEAFNFVFPGRDVGNGFNGDPTQQKPIYSWQDCLTGQYQPNACELLHALYWEMDRRYQHDDSGKFLGGEPIIVALDEFLLYSQLPGVKELWSKLVREARKVSIRLILMVQGASVESLDIKGQGDLRNNLRYIRMGVFAKEHIREQVGRSRGTDEEPYWKWVTEQIKKDEYFVTVDNRYGIAPPPGTWQLKALPVATVPQVSHSSPTELVTVTTPLPPEPTPDEVAMLLGKTPEALEAYLSYLYESAKASTAGTLPSGHEVTRQYIIKHIWGFESKQYQFGCSLWNMVEGKYGKVLR